MDQQNAQPFLKWAGGKRQLLPHIRRFYPKQFGCYWEPFLGSGAVFFDLVASDRIAGHSARLLDSNGDLIACYECVRDSPDAVIAALQRFAAGHAKHGPAHYYQVRDGEFNPLRKSLISTNYTPDLAAMLIYLNRTGFNGLFRLNAAGAFNVPAGRYKDPSICHAANIRRVAAALKQPGVEISCWSFDRVLEEARAGDFVYFDPPYAPVSRTAQFREYTAQGFGRADQRRLQEVIIELVRRRCYVLLSNSTTDEIAELYQHNDAAIEAGLRCYRVPARRAINSNATRRGPIAEFLITNIRPARSSLSNAAVSLRMRGAKVRVRV